MRKKRPHRRRRLYFIEFSVFLTLLSLLFIATQLFNRCSLDERRVNQTHRRLDVVEQAILAFVSEYSRLPCPSVPNLPPTHFDFGKEMCSDVAPLQKKEIITKDGEHSFVLIGSIPARTLHLPESTMIDGWKRRILYAVAQPYTEQDPCETTSPFCQPPKRPRGIIQIEVEETESENATKAIHDDAFYVLISHGKNGFGAWTKNGANSIDFNKEEFAASSERTNANFKGYFIRPFPSKKNRFDDIVRYKHESQLIDLFQN